MKLEVELSRDTEKLWKAILEDEYFVNYAYASFEEWDDGEHDADRYADEETKEYAISKAIELLYKELKKPINTRNI